MRTIVALLLLFGCSPSSVEDFQKEGESICRELTQNLKKIETREDLVKAAPKIKSHFENLVDLMIEARKFQEEEPFEPDSTNVAVSDALKEELKRIYKIEAGRETIEKAQKEALLRLDAFEKSLKKKKTAY